MSTRVLDFFPNSRFRVGDGVRQSDCSRAPMSNTGEASLPLKGTPVTASGNGHRFWFCRHKASPKCVRIENVFSRSLIRWWFYCRTTSGTVFELRGPNGVFRWRASGHCPHRIGLRRFSPVMRWRAHGFDSRMADAVQGAFFRLFRSSKSGGRLGCVMRRGGRSRRDRSAGRRVCGGWCPPGRPRRACP